MAKKKKDEYFNGVHWSELPEYHELTAALKAHDAFQKRHAVDYCGYLLPSDRWLLEYKPAGLFNHESSQVFRENLTPEENAEYDALFERMRAANVAYLKIVRPGILENSKLKKI